jgi:hypothetical protein
VKIPIFRRQSPIPLHHNHLIFNHYLSLPPIGTTIAQTETKPNGKAARLSHTMGLVEQPDVDVNLDSPGINLISPLGLVNWRQLMKGHIQLGSHELKATRR